MNSQEKADLIIKALQQRIGEIVSQYETHIAVLRAEITEMTDNINSADNKE